MYTESFLHNKTSAVSVLSILICVIFATVLPIATVKAAPLIVVISQSSGPVGVIVTVSGSGATANGEVRVYVAMTILGFFAATTTANSTGGFLVNITVPAFPAGNYFILALDTATGNTGMRPFQIQTSISLSSDSGTYNDEISIEGHGFDSDTPITIKFDGENVTPIPQPRTDNFGSFKAKFAVPSRPGTTYNVEADDGSNTASAKFLMFPKITLSAASGRPAKTIFVNGTGFAPTSTVTVEFGGINVTMYPTLTTNSVGSFIQLFLVPDAPDGEYAVTATDKYNNSAAAQFIIPSPIMILTPNTISAPAIVTAYGKGLPPNIPIALYLENVFTMDFLDLMVESQKLYTDDYGNYEYSFVVPISEPGVYNVTAYAITGSHSFDSEKLAMASLSIIENSLLIEIEDKIANIIVPDLGTIKTSLSAIDAKIVSIEGNIATINSTIGLIQADISDIGVNITAFNGNVATIQTVLGIIEGTITSVEGNIATIETEVGTIRVDLLNVKNAQDALIIPQYVGLALAAIAALSAIILLIMHLQVMRKR